VSLFLVGCSDLKYEMVSCIQTNFDPNQKCETIAKFRDMEMCQHYKITYSSAIDYEELTVHGRTEVRYLPHGALSDLGTNETFCRQK